MENTVVLEECKFWGPCLTWFGHLASLSFRHPNSLGFRVPALLSFGVPAAFEFWGMSAPVTIAALARDFWKIQ